MTPYVALGLTGADVTRLLADPDALHRWDRLPLAFSVIGIDRVDGRPAADATIESTVAAGLLGARTRQARFLAATAPSRDHPYNLARRVASVGHLSRGRSGLLLGTVDPRAVGGWPWPAAATSAAVSAPGTAALVGEVAVAVRDLEQSWPAESVIADRHTGIFVRSEEIRHVDLDGRYRIAGPLTVPEPLTGPSVIGWFTSDTPPPPQAEAVLDLVLGAGAAIPVIDADAGLPGGQVGGVLVRAGDDRPIGALLDAAERLLVGAHHVGPGPLRHALGLPRPVAREGRRRAFAAPEPLASR
ncbi:LLM class flavin-dependent oxidoreductase [Gordonia desulfuricans]|uniref:LLM class flavin-dependent oxidoreductase n=1 Tax=Gordonia desulfuricans TaxID=89051 RepID=A0A7K3LLI5_9ACTN|nr:LLM class flavin-dependent oxidoreductase [Gordonia desulfuricans]NDK89106.1 LLM class flavin-dependent oxidoreductase [Gordonia desulfuricans]